MSVIMRSAAYVQVDDAQRRTVVKSTGLRLDSASWPRGINFRTRAWRMYIGFFCGFFVFGFFFFYTFSAILNWQMVHSKWITDHKVHKYSEVAILSFPAIPILSQSKKTKNKNKKNTFLHPCIKLGRPKGQKCMMFTAVMQHTLKQHSFKKCGVVHPATVHMHTNTDLPSSFILC